eukprot:4669625-Prymnesium_polylepis.2
MLSHTGDVVLPVCRNNLPVASSLDAQLNLTVETHGLDTHLALCQHEELHATGSSMTLSPLDLKGRILIKGKVKLRKKSSACIERSSRRETQCSRKASMFDTLKVALMHVASSRSKASEASSRESRCEQPQLCRQSSASERWTDRVSSIADEMVKKNAARSPPYFCTWHLHLRLPCSAV